MKIAALLTSLMGLVSFTSPTIKPTASAPASLTAQYIEVRTASVFAGPCHVNGELMTTGNDAMMAWNFTNGIRVMAAVSCDDNLIHTDAARQSEILIDSPNGKVSGEAALQSILSHDSASLGKIIAIRYGSISFKITGDEYLVDSPGFGSINVQELPDHSCCKQPNNVWYQPLVSLRGRMVGYTLNAQYSSGRAGETWQREDENGAFYGVAAY
jgi:hypothetical protein